MNDAPISRRRLIRYCGLGTLAGLSGCLGGDSSDDETSGETDSTDGTAEETDSPDGSSDTGALSDQFQLAGDGTVRFEPWLSPAATHPTDGEIEILFAYRNFVRGIEEGTGDIQRSRQQEASFFGAQEEDFKGEIFLRQPEEGMPAGSVLLGDYDTEEIVEHLESEGRAVSGEYEGYTLFGERLAIGADAILITAEYERFIDTRLGTGRHLRNEYEDIDILLALQPDGVQITASRRQDLSDVSVTATSFVTLDDSGGPARAIRTFVFESESDAGIERAEEIASDGRYERTLSSERNGRVVMLEYET